MDKCWRSPEPLQQGQVQVPSADPILPAVDLAVWCLFPGRNGCNLPCEAADPPGGAGGSGFHKSILGGAADKFTTYPLDPEESTA